jgi:hypothetical protein
MKRGKVTLRLACAIAAAVTSTALAACTSSADTTDAAATPETTTQSPTMGSVTDLTPTILDAVEGKDEILSDLAPGTYSLDPDLDPSTPLHVTYELPDGWKSWIGAAKPSPLGHVGVSISTISNVVSDGCRDHSWVEPPIGPSVDDLATALADLAPFRVTSPPRDVSMYGYRGQHLELTVPDLPFSEGYFEGCSGGQLKSWVAAIDTQPGDAYYGYTGPGYVEEFWLLDVDGTRLMIAAERSPKSPTEDLEELRSVLHSIEIEA